MYLSSKALSHIQTAKGEFWYLSTPVLFSYFCPFFIGRDDILLNVGEQREALTAFQKTLSDRNLKHLSLSPISSKHRK